LVTNFPEMEAFSAFEVSFRASYKILYVFLTIKFKEVGSISL